ncbi:MAG: hypothetical protein P4M08_06020 [Oligoflexia bacterium]|nr:hypothetical protein [Oligoflexia bacterium]
MVIDSDILSEFRAESNGLLKELKEIVSRLETETGRFPEKLLTEYAQKIDRIMGAAKTIGVLDPDHIGLKSIGTLAELCKSIGYKAATKRQPALMPFFAAFLSDTIEVIESLVKNLDDTEASRIIASEFSSILQGRLAWLKSKVEA